MPGLGTQITDNAHALAMGKVVLARLRPEALARYVGSGLTRYTPSTITSPVELSQELQRVRADGYAVEREEFDLDFCCVAAPALDEHGRLAGVLGLSASTRAFDNEHDELTAAVRDIAAAAGPARRAGGAVRLSRRSSIVRKSTSFLSARGRVVASAHHCSRPRAPGSRAVPVGLTRRRSRQ